MGKGKKALVSFIESIPDDKLLRGVDCIKTLHKNTHFRLDNQGITSDKPAKWNFQVQINREATISTLKRSKGKTVSMALVPTDGSWTAKQIRQALIAGIAV